MQEHGFRAVTTGRPLTVDACSSCQLFWFDQGESPVLDATAVRALLQVVAASDRVTRRPLRSSFGCPRCDKQLAFTHDLQRNTRFNYWRCAAGHGRLTAFHAFLREKNFVRAPTSVELARLREYIRQISCSQCGAPVDIVEDQACRHCGSAIALIDPDGVAKALRPQERAAPAMTTGADEAARREAIAQATLEAFTAAERERGHEALTGVDLIAIRAGTLAALLGGWLR